MSIRRVITIAVLAALLTVAGAAPASAAGLTVSSSSSEAGQDTTITVSGTAAADSTVYLTFAHDRTCGATESVEEGQSSAVAGSPANVTAADPFTKQFTHHFDNSITTWKFCAYLYPQGASTSDAPAATGSVSVVTGTKPSVQAQGSQGVGATTATIQGGFQSATGTADAHLEYGTDTTYGQSTGATSGTSGSVSATLTGLTPSTTYHWRVVATNAYGTTESPDQTFVTTAGPPPSTLSLTAPTNAKHHGDLKVGVSGTAGEPATIAVYVDPSGFCGPTLADEKAHAGIIQVVNGGAPGGPFAQTSETGYGPAAGVYVLCGYLNRTAGDQADAPAATASAPLTVTHSACPSTDITATAPPVVTGYDINLDVTVPGPGLIYTKSSDQQVDGAPGETAGEVVTQVEAAGTYKARGSLSALGTKYPSLKHPVALTYAVRFVPTGFFGDPVPDVPPTGPSSSNARSCQLPDGTVVDTTTVTSTPHTVKTALDNTGLPDDGAEPTPADAALKRALAPSGAAARIAKILKAGGYTAKVAFPSAGKATVTWTYTPKGASSAAKRKPVVVASGTKSATKAGSGKLKIKLTRKGRALLKKAKSLKLTAKGSFKPAGGGKIPAAAHVFKLKR